MCWAQSAGVCDLPGPILIVSHPMFVSLLMFVSLSAFQMSHSSLCVALLGLASSVSGQAPSGGFMDNINFDDFIHRSRTPG